MSDNKAKPFVPKLTKQQKNEIFMEFVGLYSRREQLHFSARKAKELGVSYKTIDRIISDQKRWDAFKASCERIRDRELARAYACLPAALDVPLDLIRNADKYEGGLKQYPLQAANSLMDRLNFREKSEENNGVNINFVGGMPEVNMPTRSNDSE